MAARLELEFDEMREEDVEAVARIERESFAMPWSEDVFREEIQTKANYSHFLVVRHAGKTIAYTGFWLVAAEAHIANFAVDAQFRQQGVGSCLMAFALQRAFILGAQKITLEVRVSNFAAQRLYQKFRFKIAAIRKRFYPDNGEDAYLMWIPDLTKEWKYIRQICAQLLL